MLSDKSLKTGALSRSLEEVDAVGHRVVHGGEKFASSVDHDRGSPGSVSKNATNLHHFTIQLT
ncbi:MAG: hypothetical protein ACLR78_00935 [Roseburia sp.]